MATDFTNKITTFPGGLIPTLADTPLDIRTRVETEADILSIPKPYIGMVVYVKDTGKRFEVLTLKDKKQGLKVVKNAAVNTYRELIIDLSNYATKDDISRIDTDLEALKNVDLSSLHTHNNKNILDNITEVDINTWNAKSDFSGSYNDLTDTPTIPTKVSELINDLSLATETFVSNKIAEAQLAQGEIDLSGYATKDDLSKYVSTEELEINLTDYVKLTDLEAKKYATKEYVDDRISNHDHNVMTEADADEMMNNLYVK